MNQPTHFIMYFHHAQFPVAPELRSFNCPGCKRTVFKANSQNIVITNDIGLPWQSYDPSQHIIEIQCHSCKNKFKILFQ